MTTFRDWLGGQEDRDDATGWTARFWRDLPDKPRLSSPNSIERHMRERGLFESQAGLTEAWDTTMAEYRQQRMIHAATETGVTPEQLAASVARHPSSSPAGERAAPQNVYTGWPQAYLESMNAKLDAIMTAMGLSPAGVVLGYDGDAPPIDWQAAFDTADHDAVAE
jgi:hypothetical protein